MYNKKAEACLLACLTLFAVSLFTVEVNGQPTISTLNLPYNYIPIGIVYKEGYIWTVSYTFGAISKINLATGEVTHYYFEGVPDTDYSCQFYGLAIDVNGNFWIAGQKLVMFNPSTGTFTVKLNVAFRGIGYYNGHVYFAVGNTLYKYDVATDAYTTFTLPASGSYYGFVNDASGNIWFSDVDHGCVYKFDGTAVTQFAGFHRPLGLAPSGGYVYVAENVRQCDDASWSPAIARLNPSDSSIARMNVAGSPYGILVFNVLSTSYVAYSSSGEDAGHTRGIGVGVFGGSMTFFNIAVPAVYYLNYQPTANALYFTFYGSGSGVGEFSDPVSEVLLASDSNTVDVAVNQLPVYQTSLTLEADKATIFVGDKITFTSTLKYANGTKAGQPVGAGKPVKLLINGHEVASGQTDANGQWSYTYTFNTAGTYTVQSKFEGGTFSPYYSESSSATLNVTVVSVAFPWDLLGVVVVAAATACTVAVLLRSTVKRKVRVDKVEGSR